MENRRAFRLEFRFDRWLSAAALAIAGTGQAAATEPQPSAVIEALGSVQVVVQPCPAYSPGVVKPEVNIVAAACALSPEGQDENSFRRVNEAAAHLAGFPFVFQDWTHDWLAPEDGSMYRVLCRDELCDGGVLLQVLWRRLSTSMDYVTYFLVDGYPEPVTPTDGHAER